MDITHTALFEVARTDQCSGKLLSLMFIEHWWLCNFMPFSSKRMWKKDVKSVSVIYLDLSMKASTWEATSPSRHKKDKDEFFKARRCEDLKPFTRGRDWTERFPGQFKYSPWSFSPCSLRQLKGGNDLYMLYEHEHSAFSFCDQWDYMHREGTWICKANMHLRSQMI